MKHHILKFSTREENGTSYVNELCPFRQTNKSGVFGLGSWKCEQECPHCLERDRKKQIVKCDFRILDLSLTYHWYDEIEAGRKAVEYRELKPFYMKMLTECYKNCVKGGGKYECRYCSFFKPIHYDAVRFHRGQGGKKTMMFEFIRTHINPGFVFLGAPLDKNVFNIYIGKRLQ